MPEAQVLEMPVQDGSELGRITAIERRLEQGSSRMTGLESSIKLFGDKLDNHIATSQSTNSAVAEVLEILHAGKGFFKVVGYLGHAIKWVAAIAAPVLATWYAWKGGK